MSLPEGSSGIAVVLLVLSVHMFFQLFRSGLVVSDYDIERNVFTDYRRFQKLERNCKALKNCMKRHDRSLYLVILLKQIKSSVYEESKKKMLELTHNFRYTPETNSFGNLDE